MITIQQIDAMLRMQKAVSGLSRRLVAGHGDAFALSLRHLSGSPASQHVQPVPAEDASPSASPEQPRWLRELGTIRTDWT